MLRFLLFPISCLYGFIVFIRRNVFYKLGWFKQTKFNIPVICVGNISMGGTGKTPHTEYLTRLLMPKYKIATLSRGYKRKTSGFICANASHLVSDIGDEPLQYFQEFGEEVMVAVDEKRVRGIEKIMQINPDIQVVILDDAFQHLSVKAGLNIILTDYFKPYPDDYILPTGTLREYKSAANDADIIIVTKCPSVLSPITRDSFLHAIKPKPHQKVFFSYFSYGDFVPITPKAEKLMGKSYSQIILLTGIANPYPLNEYLMNKFTEIHPMAFSDHHTFTEKDIAKIVMTYQELITTNKAIITTQKDAMRLLDPSIRHLTEDIPIYYIPLEVKFHKSYQELFDKEILEFVSSFYPHQ
ncbi:MAG: tetraacyldisaccharide 4'-kinase [Bacteroidota bacterium]